MSFLITGLPRSRTAWLSVFMTAQGEFCYHEGCNKTKSWDDYLKKMENCGNSDSAIALHENIKTLDCPIVIIERDINEVYESCCKLFKDIYIMETLEKIQENLKDIEGLRIPYYNINDRLKDIWSYCTDKPYNEEISKQLIKMNIQSTDFSTDLETIKFLLEGETWH